MPLAYKIGYISISLSEDTKVALNSWLNSHIKVCDVVSSVIDGKLKGE